MFIPSSSHHCFPILEIMKTLNILLFLFSPLSWIPGTFGHRIVPYSFQGVPIDYSYTETAHNSTHFVSVPGCPESIDGYPWVIFKDETGIRCYVTGQGADVCKNSKHVVHARLGSKFGVCSCDFTACIDSNRTTVSHEGRYTFCSKQCEELVYDEVEKTCYEMYKQGPCTQNEWLSRDGMGGIECRPRLCFGDTLLYGEDEKRYSVNKYISADDISCCEPDKIVSVASISTSIGKTNCGPGKVFSALLSRCKTSFQDSRLVIGSKSPIG